MQALGSIAVYAGAGGLAGSAGRWLLGRLRRGTSVHIGWCEGAVALLWGVLGWRAAGGHLPGWWLPVPLLLTWFAVLLTATDLRHRRLPDALTLPAYPIAATLIVTAAWLGGGWPLARGAALGALAFFAIHAAVHVLRPRSLGAGDVKLSGPLGAILGAVGWPALILAAWLAALTTLALRLVAPRHTAATWWDGIPHAPGLLAATTLVALFPGPAVAPAAGSNVTLLPAALTVHASGSRPECPQFTRHP
ncbi:MAG TPA: A24 family peptidase [Actinophytocola sp.]|uniref:A24 family peptidase n=1 Tax=Actinophytocola sp. TaxID=1872138 RepID=UPI002DDD49ED|nr:A24 family peptidase [Actinophytocola sp.]HEV2779646.1 A24 family peptidase [Actinophytocola sp.]